MCRRQYERALRLLWEHRDRLRGLALQTPPRRRRRSTSPDSLSPDDLPPSLLNFPPPCPADFPSAPATDFSSLLPSSCLPPAPPPAPEPAAPQHPPKPENTKLRNEPKPAASRSKKASSSPPPSRPSRPRPSRPPERTIPPQTQTAVLAAPAETRILRNEPKPGPRPRRSRPAQPASHGSGRVLCRERSRPQTSETERYPSDAPPAPRFPSALPSRFPLAPPPRQHPARCPLPPRNPLPRNARQNAKSPFCETNRNPPRLGRSVIRNSQNPATSPHDLAGPQNAENPAAPWRELRRTRRPGQPAAAGAP